MTTDLDAEWQDQPDDPDLSRDLGYDLAPWEVIPVENNDSDHRVLLPTDEEMLKRDAYVIAPAWLMKSLEKER